MCPENKVKMIYKGKIVSLFSGHLYIECYINFMYTFLIRKIQRYIYIYKFDKSVKTTILIQLIKGKREVRY